MRRKLRRYISYETLFKNKEGDVKYTVDMYCGHPNMVGNSTASVGCDGKCEHCEYGVAQLSLKDFYKIIRYANIDFKQ